MNTREELVKVHHQPRAAAVAGGQQLGGARVGVAMACGHQAGRQGRRFGLELLQPDLQLLLLALLVGEVCGA